ncbi:MAG: response regulator [Candidatus Electrothrix sp. AUS4]|nr:response regulator [Candidatus Electrothrix sp. AUS4]
MDNQLLLRHLLEDVGFEVVTADNGVEAVKQYEAWQPKFIYMDRRMPEMDGVKAAQRIRALAGEDTVKIVAVTASSFQDQDAELKAAGFDAIIHKPYRPEQIFACMEELLGVLFLRAEEEPDPIPAAAIPVAELRALPEALRQELESTLRLLDVEHADELIDRIEIKYPELAAALHIRIRNYDYDAILKMLQTDKAL